MKKATDDTEFMLALADRYKGPVLNFVEKTLSYAPREMWPLDDIVDLTAKLFELSPIDQCNLKFYIGRRFYDL